jgi:hypothetical protein
LASWSSVDRWRRPVWLGLTIFGGLAVAWFVINPAYHGFDTLAYWFVDPAEPYRLAGDGALGGGGVFRYSPTAALLIAPLHVLPWQLAVNLWLALQVLALIAIGGRWGLALVLFPPVWLDLGFGNINVFIALAVVLSFRWPVAWAFPLLTKVTPGVGIGWYVGRREWRTAAMAMAFVAGAIAIAVVLTGADAWRLWLERLATSTGEAATNAIPIPLFARVPIAFAIAIYAGMSNRRWLVPIAVTLAMPVLWLIAFTPLIALVGLRRPFLTAGSGEVAEALMTVPPRGPVVAMEAPGSG